MTDAERELFDVLLEQVIEDLPAGSLDTMPLIVDDLPDEELLSLLEKSAEDQHTICGAFQRMPRRGRSMLTPYRPETPCQVYLFREGIIHKAGGWSLDNADARIAEQIRATLRDQIAHRFEKEKDDATKFWRAF